MYSYSNVIHLELYIVGAESTKVPTEMFFNKYLLFSWSGPKDMWAFAISWSLSYAVNFHMNLLFWNHQTNLNQTRLGWSLDCLSPFNIVSDSIVIHWRWWLLQKIEISLIVYCCFIISQNELKFILQLYDKKKFFKMIYTDYDWLIFVV